MKYVGHSRVDMEVAVVAAACALFAGAKHMELREKYKIDNWQTHVDTREAAEEWKTKTVVVHLLSDYVAMLPVLRNALSFVKSLGE